MSELTETPKANRIHIAFFGLRNAGKSTLVNAFANQPVAIVSDVAGTTTDPVSKAMEILPLGPCLVTDTAGLDDEGELGALRVEKTLKVLETTDIAVWVSAQAKSEEPKANEDEVRAAFVRRCSALHIPFLEFHRGDTVNELKKEIVSLKRVDATPGLLEGLVHPGDRVLCVCPIDESAPKGRLILPQVQVIRDCLDRHIPCTVCQPAELSVCLKGASRDSKRCLVVTDSQAFAEVKRTLSTFSSPASSPSPFDLTSFSILFARQKGDLKAFCEGLEAIGGLKDGDTVLVSEGCTHHRQCNDIGTTKIPKALAKLSGGKKLHFVFSSGAGFPVAPSDGSAPCAVRPALVVHCGGCMQTRREMLRRIALCREAKIPIVNYGILLFNASTL